MWVIFASPRQWGRPGNRYIGKDGKPTDIKSQAAKFYTFIYAKRFAEKMNIELTAMTYIEQEDFTDFEIHHRA